MSTGRACPFEQCAVYHMHDCICLLRFMAGAGAASLGEKATSSHIAHDELESINTLAAPVAGPVCLSHVSCLTSRERLTSLPRIIRIYSINAGRSRFSFSRHLYTAMGKQHPSLFGHN